MKLCFDNVTPFTQVLFSKAHVQLFGVSKWILIREHVVNAFWILLSQGE